ncbi:hypothetical protein AGMMS50239_29390 [Bacteroidia bacterium]|nr:hypothetical protein AGMMS50239_29390 [Bacteroidia bacterium]
MKRIIYLVIFVIASVVTVQGQVTIGSLGNPNENALLDLKETGETSSKGLLLPRMELSSASSSDPLKEHVKGMIVYNLPKPVAEDCLKVVISTPVRVGKNFLQLTSGFTRHQLKWKHS